MEKVNTKEWEITFCVLYSLCGSSSTLCMEAEDRFF